MMLIFGVFDRDFSSFCVIFYVILSILSSFCIFCDLCSFLNILNAMLSFFFASENNKIKLHVLFVSAKSLRLCISSVESLFHSS